MVLGIVVDLSALPFSALLDFLGPRRAGIPGSVIPSQLRLRRSELKVVGRGSVYSWSETGVGARSEHRLLLGQAFRSEMRVRVRSKSLPLLG